jgi:phage gpG-like protein
MATRQTLIQRSRRVPSVEKAAHHELTGAGRGRVKRPFFGLNADDEAAIYKRIHDEIDRSLSKER